MDKEALLQGVKGLVPPLAGPLGSELLGCELRAGQGVPTKVLNPAVHLNCRPTPNPAACS